MISPLKVPAAVACNPLIFLMRWSCGVVSAAVAVVTHKVLKSLCGGCAAVVRRCVPHTPHTGTHPLEWCDPVMMNATGRRAPAQFYSRCTPLKQEL